MLRAARISAPFARVLLVPALLIGLGSACPPAFATSTYEDDQVVVSLFPGASIDEINARYGTHVLEHTPGTLDYLLGTAPGVSIPILAAAMDSDPDIDFAEENDISETAEGVQGTTPSVDRFATHQTFVTQPAFSTVHGPQAVPLVGSGTIVAIVDTGVNFGAPELAGRLLDSGYDFVDDDADPSETANGIDEDSDGTADEEFGHGTHVAGITILAASSARILPIRVLNDEGRGSAFHVFQGIDYAVTRGARVINLSLSLTGHSSIVAKGIDRAVAAGVVVIGAAGNGGQQDPDYPSTDSDVIAVAATDDSGVKLPFSNYGSSVSLCAPGQDILSSFDPLGYARWDGTSMAAPFVAGAAVRLLVRYADLSPSQVQSALEQSAIDIDPVNPGYSGELGAGLVDLEGASLVKTASRASLKLWKNPANASWATWEPVSGATSYDLIRGNLRNVHVSGQSISLGPAICVLNNTPALGSFALPEMIAPPPGQAFYYLFRPNGPLLGSSYGTSSNGLPEIPSSGGCAP